MTYFVVGQGPDKLPISDYSTIKKLLDYYIVESSYDEDDDTYVLVDGEGWAKVKAVMEGTYSPEEE